MIFNSSMVSVLDGAHIHTLYVCMSMGAALTLLDVPRGRNRVVKESKHLLRGMAWDL